MCAAIHSKSSVQVCAHTVFASAVSSCRNLNTETIINDHSIDKLSGLDRYIIKKNAINLVDMNIKLDNSFHEMKNIKIEKRIINDNKTTNIKIE